MRERDERGVVGREKWRERQMTREEKTDFDIHYKLLCFISASLSLCMNG